MGQDPTLMVDEEYREAFRQLHERAFEGQVGQLEFGGTTLKGNHRWFSMKVTPMRSHDGTIQTVLALSKDITNARLQEEMLIKVLRATAGETGDCFFEMMTRSAAELFGVEHAFVGEVLNRAEDDTPHRVRILKFYSSGAFRNNVEYSLNGAPCEAVVDGSLCHVESNVMEQFPEDEGLRQIGVESYLGVPLRSEEGKVIGIFAVMGSKSLQCTYWIETLFRIIAARISAELERTQARARQHELEIGLQHSQKLQSIGTLARGIAQDFNNILCVMMTNLEIAMEDVAQHGLDGSALEQVQLACGRARNLVKQILTFSRVEPPHFEKVSLAEVVEDAVHFLRQTIPATVTLDLSIQPDLPAIQAEPGQMRQILINLCTNAWQAMDRGQGRIDVSLALYRGAGGSEIHLVVADDGMGMDPAIQQRIFEPFFTTRPPGKGTGMGLSVVHGIVEQHQGHIRLKSEPGKGARFHIRFPVLESQETWGKALEHPPAGLSVLYVDDEESLVQSTRKSLARLGYQPTCVDHAEEALKLFTDHPDAYDMVILDYAMPGMSGLDLARALRVIRPRVPICICSGYVDSTWLEEASRVGIHEILIKPHTRQELKSVLGRLEARVPKLVSKVQENPRSFS